MMAVACSTDSPTAPNHSAGRPNFTTSSGSGCPSVFQIDQQIDQLFPGGLEFIAEAKFAVILLKLIKKDQAGAQAAMFNLVDFTLAKYKAGLLNGGQSAGTQAQVVALINSLYCIVGLPQPNISPAALGPDGAAQVVSPTASSTVVTGNLQAGIQLDQGSVTQTTLVTITRLPDSPGPLLYRGDQYPIFYELSSTSGQPLTTDQIVGLCLPNNFLPAPPDSSRLRVAHNVAPFTTGSVEILPLAVAPFLDCTNAGVIGFGGAHGFDLARVLFHKVERGLNRMVMPSPLYAAAFGSGGLGGKTKSFSPFGIVDTLFKMDPNSAVAFVDLAGSPVAPANLPSVRITTPLGRPVPGITVTFSKPSPGSGGTIDGAVQVTDVNGVATVGNWTLGADGQDTVVATPTPPNLGTGVAPPTILFIATTVPPTPIPYQAPNYRYLNIGKNAPPSGFQTESFVDTAWPLGTAAFGNAPGPDHCALDATVHTGWPAAQTGKTSDILLRNRFLVPTIWAGTVTVKVAIDNDVQIFINGTDITATGGTPVSGFCTKVR
jgi:hypothetical protein